MTIPYEISPAPCAKKNGPVTSPCDCDKVCAQNYGVEIRNLRSQVLEAPPKDREKAIEKWRSYMREYGTQI